MTPQEKAKELVDKFYNLESEGDKGGWMTISDAKQCALMCVDEIINEMPVYYKQHLWQQVKQEIESLCK